MTSLWQSVLRTRRVPRLGTLTASPDRATPSYRRFGNWVNSPSCLQNSMFVCRPRASPARRCAVVQIPVASRGQPRVAGRNRIAQARAASCCTGFSPPPAPVNGRLLGVNAALASMLPNLACHCNFGLHLRCQLTRVIATTPTRTRARSQSRAPPRGVKPSKSPCRRGAWSPPQWCVTAACA